MAERFEPKTTPAEAHAYLDKLAARMRQARGPVPARESEVIDDLVAVLRETLPDMPPRELGYALLSVCLAVSHIRDAGRKAGRSPSVDDVLHLLWPAAGRLHATSGPATTEPPIRERTARGASPHTGSTSSD